MSQLILQPTPNVGRGDVLRVAKRDFGEAATRVVALLDEYGREIWERERDRVQLAVLKLAAGDLTKLTRAMDAAKTDYRDVLGAAEYPKYTRKSFRMDTMSAAAQATIIKADWDQYASWLAKP